MANKDITSKERVLHFPENHMVGWVKVPKAGPDPRDHWEMVSDAIGDVNVPTEVPVRLIVEPHSARDLSWLQALKPDDLGELYLGQTYIRDASLVHLARLTGLEVLALSHPSGTISDLGMVHVQPLTQLRRLYLTATDVGDAGLSHLRGLNQLEFLTIGATNVTDAGLPFLYDLPSLREIDFDTAYSGGAKCLVTSEGISRLKMSLPHCIIIEDRRVIRPVY